MAIAEVSGNPAPGETVDIYAADKTTWLGRGAYSPASQIRARIWTFDKNENIDQAFFDKKIADALARRKDDIERGALTAYRLAAAEADGLPGCVIDVYADFAVFEILSAGAEYCKEMIFEAVKRNMPGISLYERSDSDVRKKEGLELRCGVISGKEPEEYTEISENCGMKFLVDIKGGHKTGHYLDQRMNRLALMKHCKDKNVLNCFSYTGGFSLYALKGGCKSVKNVDVSAKALETAKKNVANNHLDPGRAKFIKADVFDYLRKAAEAGEKFDVIVLDPPKFVDNKRKLVSGCRGYKDIAMLAFKLLSKGGILQSYSCSGLVDPALFQKITADAALDAGRDARIIERLEQAPDHPVPLPFPEALYLKGLTVMAD